VKLVKCNELITVASVVPVPAGAMNILHANQTSETKCHFKTHMAKTEKYNLSRNNIQKVKSIFMN
jgi:hypothetical protein